MPALTAVVTGAAGFLGRAVVRALRDDPSVKGVVALDRRPDGVEGVRWVRADVRDPDLHRHLEADVVVHLAFVVLGDLERRRTSTSGGARTPSEPPLEPVAAGSSSPHRSRPTASAFRTGP